MTPLEGCKDLTFAADGVFYTGACTLVFYKRLFRL